MLKEVLNSNDAKLETLIKDTSVPPFKRFRKALALGATEGSVDGLFWIGVATSALLLVHAALSIIGHFTDRK